MSTVVFAFYVGKNLLTMAFFVVVIWYVCRSIELLSLEKRKKKAEIVFHRESAKAQMAKNRAYKIAAYNSLKAEEATRAEIAGAENKYTVK